MKFFRNITKLSDHIEGAFNVDDMSTGYKRGMAIRLAPAKIKEVLGTDRFKTDLKYIKLTGEQAPKDSKQYTNPQMRIYLRPGSPWRVQIHQQRYRIKQKINERLKSEIIKDVRVY